jgi:hypothetical protein
MKSKVIKAVNTNISIFCDVAMYIFIIPEDKNLNFRKLRTLATLLIIYLGTAFFIQIYIFHLYNLLLSLFLFTISFL